MVEVEYTAAAARCSSNEFVLPPLIEICHKIGGRRAHTHKCSYKAEKPAAAVTGGEFMCYRKSF